MSLYSPMPLDIPIPRRFQDAFGEAVITGYFFWYGMESESLDNDLEKKNKIYFTSAECL